MPKIRLAPLVVAAPLALLSAASAQNPHARSAPVQTISGQVMTAHDDTLSGSLALRAAARTAR